jgi:hypothetical protein
LFFFFQQFCDVKSVHTFHYKEFLKVQFAHAASLLDDRFCGQNVDVPVPGGAVRRIGHLSWQKVFLPQGRHCS